MPTADLQGAVSTTLLQGFCLLIEREAHGETLLDFMRRNQAAIDQRLLTHGAVVLRGFDHLAVDELSCAVEMLGGKEVFYRGGLGPRTKVGKGVYTASDINKIFPIKLHQEMSYQASFPDNVVFYCEQPASLRGETTLVDMRPVTTGMPASLHRQFSELGVLYVSVFHDRNRRVREFMKTINPFYLHLTWQDAFASEEREVVERECAERDLEVVWRSNGDLETRTVLPAFRTHPVTGDEVWFNSVLSLHFNERTLQSDLGNFIYHMRRVMYADRRNLPNQVYFGDGTAIPYEALLPLYELYDKHTHPFEWQRGDLMLLDNRLVGHGRNSFRGERRVFASMLAERFAARQPSAAPLAAAATSQAVPATAS